MDTLSKKKKNITNKTSPFLWIGELSFGVYVVLRNTDVERNEHQARTGEGVYKKKHDESNQERANIY